MVPVCFLTASPPLSRVRPRHNFFSNFRSSGAPPGSKKTLMIFFERSDWSGGCIGCPVLASVSPSAFVCYSMGRRRERWVPTSARIPGMPGEAGGRKKKPPVLWDRISRIARIP